MGHSQGVANVQRNLQLAVEQAEWLRTTAFERRVKQPELVRYALDSWAVIEWLRGREPAMTAVNDVINASSTFAV